MDNRRLSDELRRLIEDTTYSSKGHFEASAQWDSINLILGLPTSVLAALSGVSALTSQTIAAALLAFLVAALTAILSFLNAEKRSESHRVAGNSYLALKNKARQILELDIPIATDPVALTETVKSTLSLRDKLNNSSPSIPRWAYKRAKKGIEEGDEATHEVDIQQKQKGSSGSGP